MAHAVNFALGAGTFVYSNTIAGMQTVAVNSGTLFDSGPITAAGVVVASGGTLAPGAPGIAGGTLNISGTLSFAAGANYLDTIIDPNVSEASVSGAATLGGGTVAISPYSAVQTGTPYTILTDSGGGLGVGGNSFSAAPISYEHLTGALSYSNPDDVVLTFSLNTAGCATGLNSGTVPCVVETGS